MALKKYALCFVATLSLVGCASAPWNAERTPDASETLNKGGEGAGNSSPSGRVENGPESIHLDPNTMPMRLNISYSGKSRSKNGSAKGYGVEYSRIHYASGSLADGEFISIYYENLNAERTRALGYRFVYGNYSLPESTQTSASITSANSLSIDGLVKFYRPNFYFVSSPYVLFSAGLGTLHWEYRAPVTDASGYTFSGDSLDFLELKTGIGGELGRSGLLHLSGYVGPVGRVYLERTSEGFNNDLFENRLDITWGANIGFRF